MGPAAESELNSVALSTIDSEEALDLEYLASLTFTVPISYFLHCVSYGPRGLLASRGARELQVSLSWICLKHNVEFFREDQLNVGVLRNWIAELGRKVVREV